MVCLGSGSRQLMICLLRNEFRMAIYDDNSGLNEVVRKKERNTGMEEERWRSGA